jgi:hypothetical protein
VPRPRPLKIVDFTGDFDALQQALSRLGPRERLRIDGDQLPEAILESARTLQQRKAERPVIVVFTIGGGQPQLVDPRHVLTTLRLSGAALNVVIATGGDLGQVMADGPRQSGGRIESAGTPSAMVPAAMRIADMLQHQYLLTYTLPDGVKMSDRVAVATSRKGVTLTSPSHLPDK